MIKKLMLTITIICSMMIANYNQPTTEQMNQILDKVAKHVWQEAMNAKAKVNAILPQVREEYLSNLASSAPRVEFITHADLGDTLTSFGVEANIYVSTDGQNIWSNNNNVYPLNSSGYESTWEAITTTGGGNNIYWYLSGLVNSEALGLDFGDVLVTQSPYNANDSWTPSNNLYALVGADDVGDAGSSYDITGVRGSYSDNKLYASLDLVGACCDEGGLFGPWNLFVVAIINPDAEEQVAYALGYGDGGFGQLYPALYKVDGDLATGEVGGFSSITEDFGYSTSGNSFQANVNMDYLINDSQWGTWPNSVNGVVLVGTTISASLDGLNIATEILDTGDVGVFVMSTQHQDGNTPPVLSDPSYDENTGNLTVLYTDTEGNLAVNHSVELAGENYNMIPSDHTYLEGAVFTLNLDSLFTDGNATFNFSDGGAETTILDFSFSGGSSCSLLGDANGDSAINVLDVVLTVNIILCADCPDNYNACSDINEDQTINVLDIVSIVNIILGPQ